MKAQFSSFADKTWERVNLVCGADKFNDGQNANQKVKIKKFVRGSAYVNLERFEVQRMKYLYGK